MAQGIRQTNSFQLSDVDFLEIFRNFDDGVIITNAEGRVVFYNHTQSVIDQLEPDQVMGRLVTEIYRLSEENSMIMRCINSGQPILNQLFFYRPHPGKLCHVLHTVYPLKLGDRVSGAICFIRNSDVIEKAIRSSAALIPEEDRDFDNGTVFTFAHIIGADPQLLRCLKKAKTAAGTKSPIMIYGETGTGKEMFAQSIHNYSRRHSKPFVAVNCAAIPENLQESTLFGTTRGAFTGSVDRPGLFEEANGGTLYLDEIDVTPQSLQAKLLRVLEERKVRRVGSTSAARVDLQIISSTKIDFGERLLFDKLRKDLFYRLSVVDIEIPPLRRRKADIDTLTRHFIDKSNYNLGTRAESASPEVLELFRNYDWPGNVRELEHVIEGALNTFDDERIIDLDHLPAHFTLVGPPGISKQGEPVAEKSRYLAVEDRDRPQKSPDAPGSSGTDFER